MEDKQIITLFLQRSEQAIVKTKEKYQSLCLSIARRILPDLRDVEECLEDVLLKVWNSIPPDQPDSFTAYLSRITRNTALDRYSYNYAEKRSTALTNAFEELECCLADSFDVEQIAQTKDFQRFINKFLRSQKQESRIYFVRRYWYGESIAEIAGAFRVSEEKVKSSLFRTRNRLKSALEKEGITV